MTVLDAINRVKDRSHRGSTSVTTDNITAQILRALNDARRDIIRVLPVDYLRSTGSISTVSGTATYSLAADVNDVLYFRYTYQNADYFPTKIKTEREFYKNVYSSQVANGKPQYYFYSGRSSGTLSVTLFPTPDATYTINYAYMKDPTATDISSSDFNSTIPDISGPYQDAVWKGALYYFLRNFDDPLLAQAKIDYDAALLELEEGEQEDQDDDLQMRFDNSRFNRGDSNTNTGIKLV